MNIYRYNINFTKNSSFDSPFLKTGQLAGPVLPLAFANAMWMLYALHDPADCKYPFLDFCLVAGCISLFVVVVGVASKVGVKFYSYGCPKESLTRGK